MSRNQSQLSAKRDIASHKRDSQAVALRLAFGERLKSFIEPLGMPDAFFARQAGIPTSTFARYLAGEALPKPEHLFPLAESLRKEARWLIYGEAPRGSTLLDAANADWVMIPRYRLSDITEAGKGDAIEAVPYRKDWLNRRLLTSSGLWITELPSDYESLGLEEGDAIICADVDAAGPAEKWVCIFRGAAGPFVARYSNRGSVGELDLPGATFVTAADLSAGDTFVIARIRARMLAKV